MVRSQHVTYPASDLGRLSRAGDELIHVPVGTPGVPSLVQLIVSKAHVVFILHISQSIQTWMILPASPDLPLTPHRSR